MTSIHRQKTFIDKEAMADAKHDRAEAKRLGMSLEDYEASPMDAEDDTGKRADEKPVQDFAATKAGRGPSMSARRGNGC